MKTKIPLLLFLITTLLICWTSTLLADKPIKLYLITYTNPERSIEKIYKNKKSAEAYVDYFKAHHTYQIEEITIKE